MSVIGQGVKLCNLVGIAVAVSFCLCSIPLWNLSFMVNVGGVGGAEDMVKSGGGGALTIVESSDIQDDDDGIVSEVIENKEDGEEMLDEMFEATSEWKPVKKGQKIPPGLHVRLNLQTGEKEAKLMSEPTNKAKGTNQWYAGEKMGTINTEKQRYTRDELKQALKDFKFEESDTGETEQKDLKQKGFRSYDELQKLMKDIDMSVKTEAEIVTGLVNKLKDSSTNMEDVKTILVDVEYYLHQLDNARLFCDLDGMQVMIKLMNNSEEDIRTKALLAIGSALQSNAKVQVNAIENGVMQQLLRLISVDLSVPVKKKSLFALSTLLRQFPYAQRKFLEVGGLSVVTDLFSKSKDELLKIKIITLLTDLVQENDLHSVYLDGGDEAQSEKARQYSEVKMRDALHKFGWCTHLTSLLHQHSGHDSVEKILSAMSILKSSCQDQFLALRPTLQYLSSQYSDLAQLDKEQGETDTFFATIHSNIEQLLKDIKFKREDL